MLATVCISLIVTAGECRLSVHVWIPHFHGEIGALVSKR
jgi:hypothetical protein